MKNYNKALVAVVLMVASIKAPDSQVAEKVLLSIEDAVDRLINRVEEQQLIIDGQEQEITYLKSVLLDNTARVSRLDTALAYHKARNTPVASQARYQGAADNLAALHQDLDQQIVDELEELANVAAQRRFDQGRDGHYSDDEDL